MLLCTGAVSMNEQDALGYDVKKMREMMFSDVVAEALLVHCNFGMTNLRIMILIVSQFRRRSRALLTVLNQTIYCWQTERFNLAWHWCTWAIRLVHYLPIGLGAEKMASLKRQVDFLNWNVFMIEK